MECKQCNHQWASNTMKRCRLEAAGCDGLSTHHSPPDGEDFLAPGPNGFECIPWTDGDEETDTGECGRERQRCYAKEMAEAWEKIKGIRLLSRRPPPCT